MSEVFAELAGRVPVWRKVLEDFDMTESQVANEWIARGELNQVRKDVVKILNRRFPNAVPQDVTRLIQEQDSLELLDHWFQSAIDATTFDEFLAVLKA